MLSLGIISWKESFHFLFQSEGLFFRWGELHLEVDGEPHGQGITFDREGFSKKIVGWGEHAPPPPTIGNPCMLLINLQS